MDVLHHHLETIEATSFWDLDFSHESLSQVFKNDTIGSCEECKDHFDEMPLFILKLFPVLNICCQIDFFSGPEASHLLFVKLPYIIVFDWEDHKSVWVFLEKWLRLHLCQSLGYILRRFLLCRTSSSNGISGNLRVKSSTLAVMLID